MMYCSIMKDEKGQTCETSIWSIYIANTAHEHQVKHSFFLKYSAFTCPHITWATTVMDGNTYIFERTGSMIKNRCLSIILLVSKHYRLCAIDKIDTCRSSQSFVQCAAVEMQRILYPEIGHIAQRLISYKYEY